MNLLKEPLARLSTMRRLFQFLSTSRNRWLIPMVLALIIGTVLVFAVESSPVGAFIYTMF